MSKNKANMAIALGVLVSYLGRAKGAPNKKKIYEYDGFGETLAFAESLGWVDIYSDAQTASYFGAQRARPDEIEEQALEFIKSKGYRIDGYDTDDDRSTVQEYRLYVTFTHNGPISLSEYKNDIDRFQELYSTFSDDDQHLDYMVTTNIDGYDNNKWRSFDTDVGDIPMDMPRLAADFEHLDPRYKDESNLIDSPEIVAVSSFEGTKQQALKKFEKDIEYFSENGLKFYNLTEAELVWSENDNLQHKVLYQSFIVSQQTGKEGQKVKPHGNVLVFSGDFNYTGKSHEDMKKTVSHIRVQPPPAEPYFTVENSMSGRTGMLVIGDNPDPSEIARAKKFGIPILTERQFFEGMLLGFDPQRSRRRK